MNKIDSMLNNIAQTKQTVSDTEFYEAIADSNLELAAGNEQIKLDLVDYMHSSAAYHSANLPLEHGEPRNRKLGQSSSRKFKYASIKDVMAECDAAYRQVGIAKKSIDLMVDFAIEGAEMVHIDPKIELFYQKWWNKIEGVKRSKEILHGLYRLGNIAIYKLRARITLRTERDLLKALRKYGIQSISQETIDLISKNPRLVSNDKIISLVKAFINETTKVKKRVIPWKYIVLSPFRIEIIEPSLLNPIRTYLFKLTEADLQFITGGGKTKEEKQVADELRPMIIKDQYLELESDRVYFFHYKKASDESWGDPPLFSVLDDIKFKKVLRRMDISAAESVIQNITIFKLGNTKEGFPPTPNAFKQLATILKTPTKSMNIVWSDQIDISNVAMPVGEILGAAKYEQVNSDILQGIGISPVIIGGGGAGESFSNSFLGVKGFLEILEDGREELLSFWNREIAEVADAMRFDAPAKLQFNHMSLRDEVAEKNIIIGMYDRGLISAATTLNETGFDFEIERAKQSTENKIRAKEDVFQQKGPFIRDPGLGGPQPATGPVGRPSDKGDTQTRKLKKKNKQRKPVGMGVGEDFNLGIMENLYADDVCEKTEQIVSTKYLKDKNKQYWKSLTNDEKDELEEIILSVLEHVSSMDDVTEEKIYEFTSAPAKLVRCVKEVYTSLRKSFVKKIGRSPNSNEAKRLRSSAWAICVKKTGLSPNE